MSSFRASGVMVTMAGMSYQTYPRVDDYIDRLPDWQQDICREVRELIHAADPEVTETIKFTNRPYFVLDGNVCALLATKDHVNVFLYDGAIVPDPERIIIGVTTTRPPGTVAVRQGREDQRAPAQCHVPADHRGQPGRRLAQAQAQELVPRSSLVRRRPPGAFRPSTIPQTSLGPW